MGQDTGTEGDLLVEVALVEAEMAQLELWRDVCAEVGIEDTEWVEIGDVVSSYLVCTDEQLDL